jgi:hypothetical protein
MNPGDYILISAAVMSLFVVLGISVWRPPSRPAPPREVTRWRRFHVNPGPLHGILRGGTEVIEEEPYGLQLAALPRRESDASRVRIVGPDREVLVTVVRKWGLFRRNFQVSIQGNRWLQISVSKKEPSDYSLQFVNPADSFKISGNALAREYEILRQGKLVATVSWQEDPESEEKPECYVLETLKTDDELPLIAFVLAIEVATA